MSQLYNLARMTVSGTPGTGTITLGSAVSGHLSFSSAGVVDGEVISYSIRDGANSEVGSGVYTASGTTLTRGPIKSTNSNAAISVTSAAEVFITGLAEDLYTLLLTGSVASGATSLDFILSNYSEFRGLKFVLAHILPAATGTAIWLRVSTNGGVSYDAGSTDYMYSAYCWRSASSVNAVGTGGVAQLQIAGSDQVGSSGDGMDAIVNIYDFTTSRTLSVNCIGTCQRQFDTNQITWHFDGKRVLAQTTNAIRFMFASGNFVTGNAGRYAVFGIR